MRFSALGVIVLSLLLIAGGTPARAQESHDYSIAANDGYGLEDCLGAGKECGQVVADAWCEAHGHGHALAYGLKSAMDDRATPVSTTDESYVIRCGD